jgi:hypothetical protein
VAGATVRVERVVGDAFAYLDVKTGTDGTWVVGGILGGQYHRYNGTLVRTALAPNPPIIGLPSQLVVEVTTNKVDAAGVVRGAPVVGQTVQLFGDGQWSFTKTTGTTDGAGYVRFSLVCTDLGPQRLSVVAGAGDVAGVDTPTCSPVPTTLATTTTLNPTPPGPATTARGK